LKQLKLEEENEDKIEYSISKDFEFNYEKGYYFKSCNRCGGEFVINRKDFEELIMNNSNYSIFVNLQCDSCSLSFNVLLL
jgi:hypothetical protein